MRKIKFAFIAGAFLLATGAAFATKTSTDPGWYVPDIANDQDGQPQADPPSGCNDINTLCATQYNAAGQVTGMVFEP